jgi:hypothetical protein
VVFSGSAIKLCTSHTFHVCYEHSHLRILDLITLMISGHVVKNENYFHDSYDFLSPWVSIFFSGSFLLMNVNACVFSNDTYQEAGIAQSLQGLATCWTTKGSEFVSR